MGGVLLHPRSARLKKIRLSVAVGSAERRAQIHAQGTSLEVLLVFCAISLAPGEGVSLKNSVARTTRLRISKILSTGSGAIEGTAVPWSRTEEGALVGRASKNEESGELRRRQLRSLSELRWVRVCVCASQVAGGDSSPVSMASFSRVDQSCRSFPEQAPARVCTRPG